VKRKARETEPSDEEASGTDSEAEEQEAEAASAGAIIPLRNPKAAAGFVIPADVSFTNPNNTLFYLSQRHQMKVHWSEVVPDTFFKVKTTTSQTRNGLKSYFSVTNCVNQKFNLAGNSAFGDKIPFGKAMVLGPFGALRYPEMWPYGNRFPPKDAKFPAPGPGNVRYKMALTASEYSSASSVLKEGGGGTVDDTMDSFITNWVHGRFDAWSRKASWPVSSTFFPERRKEMQDRIESNFRDLRSEYEEKKKKWDKGSKKKPAPEEPDTSDAAKERELNRQWMREGFSNRADKEDKNSVPYVNFSRDLMRFLTKKEQEDKTNLSIPVDPDGWFKKQQYNPDKYTKKVGNEELLCDGFHRVKVDLPLYRCVTLEEAIEDKKNKRTQLSPYRLVPVEKRWVVYNDVCAPLFSLDVHDTTGKSGPGWRFVLEGVLWLGEANKLPEHNQEPPRAMFDPAQPKKYYESDGFDPTTYFLVAQKYTRDANFKPGTVERPAAAAAMDPNVGMEHTAFAS
jgi:hypothetical protein